MTSSETSAKNKLATRLGVFKLLGGKVKACRACRALFQGKAQLQYSILPQKSLVKLSFLREGLNLFTVFHTNHS